jgi:hypothetical protein
MTWRPAARVLVKAYAARTGCPRRVQVVHYAATVERALAWARARGGALWIEAREWPAQRGVRPRAVYG